MNENTYAYLKYAAAVSAVGWLLFGTKGALIGAIAGWFGAPRIASWLYRPLPPCN